MTVPPTATVLDGLIASVFPEVVFPFVPRFFTNAIAAPADGESARRNASAMGAAASGHATMRRSRLAGPGGVALLIRFSWYWSFVLAWEKAMRPPTRHLPPPGRSMSPQRRHAPATSRAGSKRGADYAPIKLACHDLQKR